MNAGLHHHPTPTELAVHSQHRAFHRKIAEKARALAEPASPYGPFPSQDAVRRFYSDAWFYMDLVMPNQTLSPEHIKRAVCDAFKMEMHQMITGRRSKTETLPRMLAMYLCRELTNWSLPRIGKGFGTDHKTIANAWKRVPVFFERDPKFRETADKLRIELRAML